MKVEPRPDCGHGCWRELDGPPRAAGCGRAWHCAAAHSRYVAVLATIAAAARQTTDDDAAGRRSARRRYRRPNGTGTDGRPHMAEIASPPRASSRSASRRRSSRPECAPARRGTDTIGPFRQPRSTRLPTPAVASEIHRRLRPIEPIGIASLNPRSRDLPHRTSNLDTDQRGADRHHTVVTAVAGAAFEEHPW